MAKLLFTIAFFVNEFWNCEGGYPALSTVRVGGLMMQDIKKDSLHHARIYTDLRFTCNGAITAWVVLTDANYVSRPQLQIWETTNGGQTYNLTNLPASRLSTKSATQNVSFRNGSVLGLHQPVGPPYWLLYVQGGSPSYSAPVGATTISTTAEPQHWNYPLVGVVTDPPGCFTGLSTKDVLYIVKARRQLSNTCACTLNGSNASCNFLQCSNIKKFYIGVVFMPTFLRNAVLRLHITYCNGTSNVTLVMNGTPNISTFTFAFVPPQPLATSSVSRLHLTDGNNESVAFASLVNGQPLIAVQCTDRSDCSSSSLEQLHNSKVFQTAYRSMQTTYPYNYSLCQQCLLPNMTFTSTGAVARWTFTAANQNSSSTTNTTSYPHFELWRKASDEGYTLLNSTAGMQPMEAGPPNVYEYRLETPWSFQEGDIPGFKLPPPDASQLALMFVINDTYLMYCPSDNFTLCSNLSIVPLLTPEVLPNVVLDNSTVAMTLTSLASYGISITSSDTTSSISHASSTPNPSVLHSSVSISSITDVPTSSMPTFSSLPASTSSTQGDSAGSTTVAPVIGPIVGPVLGAILLVGLVLCLTAFIVNRRKRRKMVGRYMVPLRETLVLENVIYDGVSQAQPLLLNEALHNPLYNNNYENGLNLGKHSIPVEYAVVTNSSATLYNQFPVQSGELYWEPSSTSEQLYEQLSQYQYNHIPRSAVTVLEHLGSGEFGTVSKGLWRGPNRVTEVALKTLREGAQEKDRVRFLREAAIMGQFHHPNVVQLYGVVTVGDPLMIVLELMSGGDLRQLLIGQKQRASLDPWLPHRCLQFCCQIASGMTYLAKKAFIHRDLAARNILVCNDGDMCKIADFGMSRDLQDEDYYRSNGGKIPVKWTAPEALHYKTYSHASDVWSFGCVMYEIWSLGRKPFEEHTNQEVLWLIDSGYRLTPPPGCPKAIYGLMMQCWNPDKSLRPSFEAILRRLSEPEDRVLQWEREDALVHPQCSSLGVPLDCGSNLYPSLQRMYL